MHTYFKFSIAFNYVIMLHYIYIKFRAQNFHYVSKTPMKILSQDFISEFHLLFQQRLLRFLMKLLVHRSFQWFPALIQLHFHRTNDTVLLNLITFSHHIVFIHCFFILKMLKYIQIVSISDSSRKEIYGNTKHNNFKWGDRIPSCLFEWCLRRLHTKFSLPWSFR